MHLDDEAELYALGMLQPGERDRADIHLTTCDACARRVARASAVVAQLADLPRPATAGTTPAAMVSRRSLGAFLALAAALFAGFAFGRLGTPPVIDDAVRQQLVHSHFRHVSLIGRTNPPISAKILYAGDGRWAWIIVDRADCRCRIVGVYDGSAVSLGEPVAHGATAELYVANAARLTRVELQTRGDHRVIAAGTLAY